MSKLLSLEFLPCPFCGSGNPEVIPNGIGDYYVQCSTCEVRTSDVRCECIEHARQRWNKRVAIPGGPALDLAVLVERELLANSHKGDFGAWKPSQSEIIREIQYHVDKLTAALNRNASLRKEQPLARCKRVTEYAADVAALCMKAAERFGFGAKDPRVIQPKP